MHFTSVIYLYISDISAPLRSRLTYPCSGVDVSYALLPNSYLRHSRRLNTCISCHLELLKVWTLLAYDAEMESSKAAMVIKPSKRSLGQFVEICWSKTMISEFSRFDIDWVSGKIQSPVFPKKSVHLQKNSERLKGALCQELKLLLSWRILGLKTKEVGNSSIINRWLLTRMSWLKFRIAFSLYHVQYWVWAVNLSAWAWDEPHITLLRSYVMRRRTLPWQTSTWTLFERYTLTTSFSSFFSFFFRLHSLSKVARCSLLTINHVRTRNLHQTGGTWRSRRDWRWRNSALCISRWSSQESS